MSFHGPNLTAFPRFSCGANQGMFVEIVKVSRHPQTGRLVCTLHLRYPRIVHGEVMTHRVFARNARSSRAVPIKTMLNEVRNDPFVPRHWTRAQRGMQGVDGWNNSVTLIGAAAQYVDAGQAVSREAAWLHLRDVMADGAESFLNAEYHKQVANRLLESFSWIDTLVTATHWANFLHLRDHLAAEPHMRDLAVLVGQALEHGATIAKDLAYDEWHQPYITDADRDWAARTLPYPDSRSITDEGVNEKRAELLNQISSARCARISYVPFDGNASYERELERWNDLANSDAVHASAMEHQCCADDGMWFDDDEGERYEYEHPELHGPLTGFIQFRKTVPNEAVHD